MNKNSLKLALAAAGLVALAPSLASAFTGNLAMCTTTAGVPLTASLSPGLSCTNATNKIQIKKATMDNCALNLAAPWGNWSGAKFNSKITAADAATVNAVTIDLKATTFGSCNFSGVGDSFGAAGAGKVKFLAGGTAGKPVKGGGGQFFAKVGGDLTTQAASASGLMTKGFAAGASIQILIGIDLAKPVNANVLACNLGSVCPPAISPSTTLALISDANTKLRIDIQDNANCVGNNNPFPCCTGAGAGNC